MQPLEHSFFLAVVVCVFFASSPTNGDQPLTPVIEFQSGPLTPGVLLDESRVPVHQVRLVLDASLTRGTLILDGNAPEFDEFGNLVGGIQTPSIRADGEKNLITEIDCKLDLVKQGPDLWKLYRVHGSGIRSSLRVATRGSLADGGPGRLMILGPDGKVTTVISCTRYGLVVP